MSSVKPADLSSENWEKEVVQKVLLEHIREQRRARRWGLFFKLLILGYLIALPVFFMMDSSKPTKISSPTTHVALINIRGEISATKSANSDNILKALKSALKAEKSTGVILRINSPGGSAVQSRYVFEALQRYRTEYKEKPIFAVIEDIGTSAAYLIACGTDEIYADKTSLVGSIGALISTFGFVDSMEKIGVTRRLYTAGEHKGILDPFSPRNPQEDAFVQTQLSMIHQAFIDDVKTGRGNRLKETDEIFSGLFWSGDDALSLGLIDGFSSLDTLVLEKFKGQKVVDYTKKGNIIDYLTRHIYKTLSHTVLEEINSIKTN
jgi:protease-4